MTSKHISNAKYEKEKTDGEQMIDVLKKIMWTYLKTQELPIGFIEGLEDDFGRLGVDYGIVIWPDFKVTCLGNAGIPIDPHEGVPTMYTMDLVDLAKIIEKGVKPGDNIPEYIDNNWKNIEQLTGGA